MDDPLSERPADADSAPYPTISASSILQVGGVPRDLQDNGGPWPLSDFRPARATQSPAHDSDWWEASAHTMLVGVVLLMLILLLARGAEMCFEKSFLNCRRSKEWPTPNVVATNNLRHRRDLELPPPLEDVFPPDTVRPPPPNPDLPPPYSECTQTRESTEEPPPLYSACYVTYSNPKDGIPSVHFFNSRRQRLSSSTSAAGRSSNVIDTGQPEGASMLALDPPGCEENEANAHDRRLVFDNGRIVKRNPDNEFVQIPIDCASRNDDIALSDIVTNDHVLEVNAIENMPQCGALVA